MAETDPLLSPGEAVEFRVPLGAGDLVVTDRRVFRLLDSGDVLGVVDRRGVTGVSLTTGIRRGPKRRALLAGAGSVLGGVVAFLLYPLSVAFPVEQSAAERMGVGGVVELFRAALAAIRLTDDVLAVLAVGLVAYAAITLVRSRRQLLVLERTDGEQTRIRAPALDDEDVEQVRRALT
jgi:hypothetical protein